MKNIKHYLIPILLLILVMIGIVYFLITKGNNINLYKEVANYQECIDAGYPSMESYPAQCKTNDGQNFTQDIGNELEINNYIRSASPRPNEFVSSPLRIEGEAVGNWFFEASFPAHLLDANGKELAVIPVTAQGEWKTTNFVPYQGTLTFPIPQTSTGILVLKPDNPSGLPENDNELRIPIKFSQYNQNVTEKTTVKVFLNNSARGAECENTLAVTREVDKTPAIARAALEELLKGEAEEEKNSGYSTLINAGVRINSLAIQNGVAKVDFNSALENNSGGSCRALGIRSQITQTLKQFPTITDVVISVEGNTDVLQP